MVICLWSAKGGSGCTTVAVAFALAMQPPVLLVDLAGDVAAVLGFDDAQTEGVVDWLGAGDSVPIDALRRLEIARSDDLAVLPYGGPPSLSRDDAVSRGIALSSLLATSNRTVIVDVGTTPAGEQPLGLVARELCGTADRALLVTRSCYLALRRAQRAPVRATGVVLVEEPGRALRRSDIVSSLGIPVVATIPFDPAVSRCVDAGLMGTRQPRQLRRAVRAAL